MSGHDVLNVDADGHSEQLVGAAVRESAETVHVASKIPPKNRPRPGWAPRRPAAIF